MHAQEYSSHYKQSPVQNKVLCTGSGDVLIGRPHLATPGYRLRIVLFFVASTYLP